MRRIKIQIIHSPNIELSKIKNKKSFGTHSIKIIFIHIIIKKLIKGEREIQVYSQQLKKKIHSTRVECILGCNIIS